MARAFPAGNTAFLVIHGIGEQRPFETLDSFAINLVKHLKHTYEPFTVEHRITERTGGSDAAWTESYVRLKPKAGGGAIDVHEYYWAYITEEKITVPEVWEWVRKTLDATKRFYGRNQELQKRYEDRRKTGRFPLATVSWLLGFASVIFPIAQLVQFVATPVLPVLPKWLQSAWQWILKKVGWVIVGYIGDVAIYTTTDVKSKHYRFRQQILKECQALLDGILRNDGYDRVVIAGHSLGSVISYDTLNRINIKANLPSGATLPLNKLAGLITFGSPLDKIAFFFREHTKAHEYVRRQIRAHLNSFKARALDLQQNDEVLANPITPKLDDLPWVNYYSMRDPVSGHLDFYKIDSKDNVVLDLPERWGVAHVGYWTHEPFYNDIAQRFL